MSDSTKTKEQLLAEIEALKQRLAQAADPQPATASEPALAEGLTRRALSAWVAPVILSLPALGTVLKPGTAHAQSVDYYGGSDDLPPIVNLPTVAATRSPTSASTKSPTSSGRCIPVPTVG